MSREDHFFAERALVDHVRLARKNLVRHLQRHLERSRHRVKDTFVPPTVQGNHLKGTTDVDESNHHGLRTGRCKFFPTCEVVLVSMSKIMTVFIH
jgi:hypothetical protein